VSACRHPPRQWHFGELMPCADPLCSDTSPGDGLVMCSIEDPRRPPTRFYFGRSFWADGFTGENRWYWVTRPEPTHIVGRRGKRARKKT